MDRILLLQLENASKAKTGRCRSMWVKWSFEGRSRRREYWLAVLLSSLIAILGFIPFMALRCNGGIFGLVSALIGLIFFSATHLFVSVRRLHDLNMSGLWILLRLVEGVPFVGWMIAIIVGCRDGLDIYGLWILFRLLTKGPLLVGWMIAIADFVVVGCCAGMRGSNKYGLDPKGQRPDIAVVMQTTPATLKAPKKGCMQIVAAAAFVFVLLVIRICIMLMFFMVFRCGEMDGCGKVGVESALFWYGPLSLGILNRH